MITLRDADRPRPTWRQYLSLPWLLTDDRKDAGWTDRGWFWRNPCENAFSTVIGVNHLPRVTCTINGSDSFPKYGIQIGLTLAFRFRYIPVALPWIAWRGHRIECGAGWKMNGSFAIPFRISGAKNSTEVTPC